MLTKLLFTAIVIIIVLVVFRTRHHKTKPPTPTTNDESPGIGVSARTIAYTLLIVVLAVSAVIFTLLWSEQHRVIDIRVTNAQGEVTLYQAHKKTIQGRRFMTLEGATVNIGDGFQVEMIEQLNSR